MTITETAATVAVRDQEYPVQRLEREDGSGFYYVAAISIGAVEVGQRVRFTQTQEVRIVRGSLVHRGALHPQGVVTTDEAGDDWRATAATELDASSEGDEQGEE